LVRAATKHAPLLGLGILVGMAAGTVLLRSAVRDAALLGILAATTGFVAAVASARKERLTRQSRDRTQEELARLRAEREQQAIARLTAEIQEKARAYEAIQELGSHFEAQASRHRTSSRRWIWAAALALALVVAVALILILLEEGPASDRTSDVVSYLVKATALLVVPIYGVRVGVAHYRRDQTLATMAETKAVLVRSAGALAKEAPEEVQPDLYRMLGASIFSVPVAGEWGGSTEPLTLLEQLAAISPLRSKTDGGRPPL
jgi:hypothetical protein